MTELDVNGLAWVTTFEKDSVVSPDRPLRTGGPRPLEPARRVVFVASAAFLWSGTLKQVPPLTWLPIDLTLVTVIFALGGTSLLLLTRRGLPNRRAVLASFLVAIVALGGSVVDVPGEVASEKEFSLYLLTVPMAIALALSISTIRHFVHFVLWATGWSVYASLALLVVGRPDQAGRLVAELGTTISFSRAAGMVLVVSGAWLFAARRALSKQVFGVLALCGVELFVIFSVGSRGPIQAVVVSILGMVLAQTILMRARDGARLVLLGGVSLVGAILAWSFSPEFSRSRILTLFEGSSADVRSELYRYTVDNLPLAPFGNGWGSWPHLSGYVREEYPHNIFLEIWFEAGIVGLLTFCLLIFLAFRGKIGLLRSNRFVGIASVGLIVYWISVANVSGDINDNRALFLVLVASCALPTSTGESSSPPRRPPVEVHPTRWKT